MDPEISYSCLQKPREVEPKRDELIGFWQELIIAASCSREISGSRVKLKLLRAAITLVELVEVFFEWKKPHLLASAPLQLLEVEETY